MMEMLAFIAGATVGGIAGLCWKLRAYRALLDRHARLTDRDARGRFVRREKP